MASKSRRPPSLPTEPIEPRRERGDVLREARERLGVSQRELGRRLGISQETIRNAEAGRSPRHSTLMAYLSAVPGLRAADLLDGPKAAPASQPSAWAAVRADHGFGAHLFEIKARVLRNGKMQVRYRIQGIAAEPDLMDTPAVRLALIRAFAPGSAAARRSLEAPPASGAALRLRDASGEHVLRQRMRRGRIELECSYSGTRSAEGFLEHALATCVERLIMEVTLPSGRPKARVRIRPEPVSAEDCEPLLAGRMLPAGPMPVVAGQTIRWELSRPLPGFAYALGWEPGERLERMRRAPWSLARTLRAARRRAGLNLRQVGEAAGKCHASVAYAEAGRDPRVETLEGYLRAMPDLSPQDLLPAVAEAGAMSPDELWDHVRDLYGYSADTIRKTLTIFPDGSNTTVIETLGLRTVRSDLRDLRVRAGLHRVVAQASPSVLKHVAASSASARVRIVRTDDGPVMHEFRFPQKLAAVGVSYTRTYAGPVYPIAGLHRAESEGSTAGSSFTAYHPARMIELIVRLPPNVTAPWVQPLVWPACIMPDADLPVLSRQIGNPRCAVTTDDTGGTTITVGLGRPFVGLRLAVAWGLVSTA